MFLALILIRQFFRIHMNFFRFFLIFEIFFSVLKNDQKSRNLDMFSQKDYTQEVSGLLIETHHKYNFFLTNLLITFGNYQYVKSMFSAPSEWLIF